ncbi:MAG: acylphosphatase [Alphaproteobacteria bacterium]
MTGPAPRKAVRACIEGRVQGVWFRAWACEQAAGLELDGWVRNRADGAVEAVFAGAPDAVERMVVLVRRGPPLAKVARVTVSDESATVEPGFRARRDA